MSQSPFTFGKPASTGASSGSLFGSSGSAFGSNQSGSTTAGPATGGLFGNVGASTTTSNTAPSIFGTSSSTPQTSGQSTSMFGPGAAGSGGAGASGFSFGGQNQATSSGQTTPTLFGGGAQAANKTSDATTPGQPATSGGIFGNAGKAGGMFGNQTGTPAPSGGSLFGTMSTTPAGPPPQSGAAGQNQPIFGQAAQKPAGELFGNLNTTGPSSTTPTTTTAAPASATTSATTPASFGGASQPPTAGGLFSGTAAGQAGKGLFGTTPAAATTQSGQAPSLFKLPSTGADSTAKPAFPSFATTSAAQPGAVAAATSSTPQKSLFPTLGGTTTSVTPSATPATAPSTGNLFSGFGAPQSTSTTTPATTATAAPTSQPPSAGVGGLFTKPAGTTPATQPSTTSAGIAAAATTTAATQAATTAAAPAAGPTPATTTATGGPALGASTAGPTPPAQSRLKNKTMDEIITRWATDLSKYQKDFREQAEKVAEWDQMLVENVTKVQKLYGNTVDAERATQEIERQLASVEGQQEELSSWLDRYEREVDEMMGKQVGPGETLQGPDQERERTYKTAERLSERLDEMGKDLTNMIEEVNSVSATLSKTNKADEPISQIVRILNSHLSQLQLIDQGTAELQAKVSAAQKAGHGLSARLGYGHGGAGAGLGTSNAVDDFYRSYMGRR